MNKFFFVILTLFISLISISQDTDEQLANYYYSKGELNKALPYFEKLYKQNTTKRIFNKYLDCVKAIEGEKPTIKLIKTQAKKYPRDYSYPVLLGKTYEDQDNLKAATKVYDDLVNDMKPTASNVINITKAFKGMGKSNYALLTLEKGRKSLKGAYPLNFQFAEVYGDLGRKEEMMTEYLDLLDKNPRMLSTIKRVIPRYVDFENDENTEYKILKNKLLERIQKNPNETIYADLLIWTFIQKKKFNSALVQAKALDKRTNKDGREVFNLGRIAANNKDYAPARKAFKYVVDLGNDFPYYYAAEQMLLNTRFIEITSEKKYTQEEIANTILEYENTMQRVGRRRNAIPIGLELAEILAFYANHAPKAQSLLEDMITYPGIKKKEQAKIKMLLADIKVLLNDIWEASLLYMQVEKDFKFETIGSEAKFKNARVFYYDGDFEWAQSQLSVLKESTSKLIANDAMKLSILITENLGLDSNYTAMRQFAKADLLLAQHKYNTAISVYDSIQKFLPFHGLADETLFRKAQIKKEQGKWNEALVLLEKIYTDFGTDILADDALFEIADIYENHLFDTTKAKEYYFKIMKEFNGSLYVTESRKRYREITEGVQAEFE